ncbi:phosphonate metabolism transcriptional regulator PhnF [Capilliphycus salinus ALCB114379]|uniref:phosphonate metabolism transcriptional regulator PhnF n=1 Tax=Capilliphycus salinus TaxID=2768948 RepID=UPI0039A4C06E
MNRDTVPVYAQIANELRQNINQGIYQVGDKLPTENQLSERFRVNRHTVRRAIALLKSEGLLRVDQGRGTFVAGMPIRYPIGKRVRYNAAMMAQGLEMSFQLLRAVEIPANSSVANNLQLSPGDPVALIERLTFIDDHPISISTGHFPLNYFPNILSFQHKMWSISQLLREVYGCDHIRQSTRVSARVVRPQDARLLRLPLNHPILLTESVNLDQDDRIIEYGVTRFRGDRMELVFENEM